MSTFFQSRILNGVPPWLRRLVGARLLKGIATPIDDVAARTANGASMRFPNADRPDALQLIGAERRIRRGPEESATTYARRLLGWWDAHRTRGGPYALLGQLYAYFFDFLNVQIEVVYNTSGRRYSMDVDGAVVRDAISWDGDGSGNWARFWVFIHAPATIPIGTSPIETDGGDVLVTDDGDTITADVSIAPDELTAEQQEIFLAIPREWSAAHIDKIYVVLLWGAGELWDYPQPVGTWDDDPGALWDEELPVVLTVED